MPSNLLEYFDLNKRSRTIPISAPTASTSAQCPKCGKLSIVAQSDSAYRCLSCDFRRDFSKDKKRSKQSNPLLALLLAGVALLIIL